MIMETWKIINFERERQKREQSNDLDDDRKAKIAMLRIAELTAQIKQELLRCEKNIQDPNSLQAVIKQARREVNWIDDRSISETLLWIELRRELSE